jgi:hypothetical protein
VKRHLLTLYQADHGGSSSNRTVERIIKESPLVQTYRNARSAIDRNFALSHLTTRHGDPDMTKTFQELLSHISKQNPHKIIPGRTSAYSIPDILNKGRLLMSEATKQDDVGEEVAVELDDVIMEL